MTTKEYLQQYAKAERRLFHLDEQLVLLRAKAEKMGGWSDTAPVQGGSGGKLETLVEQYILREQAQESERQRCAKMMSDVRRAIAAVENTDYRTLLEYRYLDALEWVQVANVMGFSEIWVFT